MNAPGWWWTQQGPPARAWPFWPGLLLLEACYRTVISARNRLYDRRKEAEQVFLPPVPTVSVGNISVGGSGKTPLAIWLAGLLRTRGRRPGIIARGYRADPSGLNDELRMAARKCPYAVVLANPDRSNAIRDAITFHGADAIILDDGFQHRKVGRDLDIVVVDATRGFGNGHMLPAGPLREPIGSLARADIVLLTRADQVRSSDLAALTTRVHERAGRSLPVGRISFQPSGLTDLRFEPADLPEGVGGAFAGIGNFGSFHNTCRQHGLDIVAGLPLADHVRYDEDQCRKIDEWTRANRLAWVVTTEKDAAKLSRIPRAWPVPVLVLAIRAVPDEQTRTLLEGRIDAVLDRKPAGL